MVATCAFLLPTSPLPSASLGWKPSSAKLGSSSLDISRTKSKYGGVQVKVNAQAPHNDQDTWSSDPDVLMDLFGIGGIVEDGFAFRQNFSIRSYEIGADRTASIETLISHLQETALNHLKCVGLLDDTDSATPEMCKRNLIWVVTKMHVMVDQYPTWGDVVQVDNWVSASGKNGIRTNWLVRGCDTGEVLTRASSLWTTMNKVTRRLSKMPDEVRAEMRHLFRNTPPVIDEDGRKLPKFDENTAEYIRTGLTPMWSDLDVNQHVNNGKYIGWILESAPVSILETHKLSSLTLEYRRECGKDSVVESLTTVSGGHVGGLMDAGNVKCQHMLRLEGGAEVMRGKTDWRPKHAKSFKKLGQISADVLMDPFRFGRIVQDSFAFGQNFSIRFYEVGADRTMTIETLMNHLQDTALNHVKYIKLLGDGFGATPEMCKRNLIWVVTRMHVMVDRYPTWGDVIRVESWVSPSGKNGMRREWLVCDCKTGQVLTRASSVWTVMNKVTRRLSKMPEEVYAEIEPHFVNTSVIDEDGRRLVRLDENTAEYIRTGLTPRWSDLDVNQHVNNVKYISWILESAPVSILETHELSSMTLEYRRECGKDSVVESLTAVSGTHAPGLIDTGNVVCQHLLRLEGGAEVMRGKTDWRPKHATSFGKLGQVPTESA